MNAEFLPLDLPKRPAGPLALVHATVVPMDTERCLHDQTLVLEDGLIRELRPSRKVEDVRRSIDCSGLYVMPGLADMYTHYWDPIDSPLYLANGITLVRTVGTPFQLAMERIAERGEFPSPRMITVSPPIDGVGPDGRTDMPRGVAMTRAEEASALVERFARAGYRQIKAFSLLKPDNLRALGRAAEHAGVRITANCPNAMTFEEAADAGVYCFDQLHNVARGHMRSDVPEPAFWDRFDPLPGTHLDFTAIRRLARFLAARKIWNVPTLVFHHRDGLTAEEAMADPELKYVSASSIKDWKSTLARWTRRARMQNVEEWRAAARERARNFLEVVRVFYEAGVPLLAGTDSLNPWNVPGASLHAELGNFVAAGMSPFAALRCATTEAARFLGEQASSGTVAVGTRADLVITRSDPLQNVGALRDIEAVCVNGYYLARVELDRMLAQRAELAKKPQPLAAVRLDRIDGTWIERIVGTECGRVVYGQSRLADGGWLLEEQHASRVPRRNVERRTNRVVLDADFKLRSCSYRVESFAGAEVGEITRSASGEYALKLTDVDGSESRSTLACERMLPSERLTLTLWPLVFSQHRNGILDAVDVEGGSLAVRQIELGSSDEGRCRLCVNRPTHSTEQFYRLGSDGRFLGMQETMPLLWVRELEPVGA